MVDLTKKKTLGEYETGALADGDTVVTYRPTNAVGEKVFRGDIVTGTAASIAEGTSTALKMYSDKALKDAVNTGAIPVGTDTEIETGTDTIAKLYAPDQLNSAINSLIETAIPDGTEAQIIAGTDTTERKYTPADINGAVKDIAVAQYAGRTAMKAATGLTAGDVVYLSEGGRSGPFETLPAGDYSAEIAADPLEGVYIELDDGQVVKRRLNGYVTPEMFGAVGDGVADDYTSLYAANTSGFSPVVYGDKDYYVAGNTNLVFMSGVDYIGQYRKSRVVAAGSVGYIGCSQSYVSSLSIAPTGACNIIDIKFVGDETTSTQKGFAFRDYYSRQKVQVEGCLGGGYHALSENDIGAATAGTLVDSDFSEVEARRCGGVVIMFGEDNNNKITDCKARGLISTLSSSATSSGQQLRCGSFAGWDIDIHTYGGTVADIPVALVNGFNSKFFGYIERFNTYAVNATQIQQSTDINVTVRIDTPSTNASVVRVQKSSGVTTANCSVAVSAKLESDIPIYVLSPVSADLYCDFNYSASGDFAYRIKPVDDSRAGYEYVTRDDRSVRSFTAKRTGATAKSLSFPIPRMLSDAKVVGDLVILGNNDENGTTTTTSYAAKVLVGSATNGTDNWSVISTEYITPSGFSSNPVLSLSQTGDDVATLDLSFTPSDSAGLETIYIGLTWSDGAASKRFRE